MCPGISPRHLTPEILEIRFETIIIQQLNVAVRAEVCSAAFTYGAFHCNLKKLLQIQKSSMKWPF